ncbi:MAG: efflux RND transporter periplasmic adaptor subunit [Isosphaeraceae bacterium]
MSIAMSGPGNASARTATAWLPWAGLAVCIALLFGSFLLHDRFFHGGASKAEADADAPAEPAGPATSATTVVLPGPKFQAAGIEVDPAKLVTLPAELGVPGRIEANLNRQVLLRPRASGVIREVKAEIGQRVKKGDVLAVLDSADVGTARLDLRARQRELSTARLDADWKRQVAANVATLIPELRKRTESSVIEKSYADRPLGTFRATLLQAYSDFDIAMHEEEKTSGLFRREIVGEHPTFVAKHTREGTQARFEAALEQARFDANLQSVTAEQNVRKAEYAVIDAAQRLRILGVPEDVAGLLARAAEVAASGNRAATEDVTAYEVAAPLDGTILAKTGTAVVSQKAEVNDVLFTLADLDTVWVRADIPESDFNMLPELEKGTIRLSAAAYPGKAFQAKLLSVGATVDPTTRTVPMLAETPNRDGLLKLGMFVRIALDTTVDSQVLTVPVSAVMEIEGQKGVFVPGGAEGHSFTFKPVKLGRVSGDRQVVLDRLQAGAEVVSKGAFILKSELSLQNETEED